MKKYFLYFLSALVIVCCLTACNGSGAGQVSAETVEIKTVEPPENGWTWEQISDVIYINNQKISNPINCNFIKSIFKIGDIEYSEKMQSAAAALYFKGKYACGIAFYHDSSEDTVNDESIVKNLVFSAVINESDINNESLICINGVRLGTSYEDLILKLGEPTENNGNMIYSIGKSEIVFRINDEGIIDFIVLLGLEK